jgi:hypothetical protein
LCPENIFINLCFINTRKFMYFYYNHLDRCGLDCMVLKFTTTYAIRTYHH